MRLVLGFGGQLVRKGGKIRPCLSYGRDQILNKCRL